MIIPKVNIVPNYILNNTGFEWYLFQDAVQEALKTSLHCLPRKIEMNRVYSGRLEEENLDFEIWGVIRDFQFDIAIIKVNKRQYCCKYNTVNHENFCDYCINLYEKDNIISE